MGNDMNVKKSNSYRGWEINFYAPRPEGERYSAERHGETLKAETRVEIERAIDKKMNTHPVELML